MANVIDSIIRNAHNPAQLVLGPEGLRNTAIVVANAFPGLVDQTGQQINPVIWGQLSNAFKNQFVQSFVDAANVQAKNVVPSLLDRLGSTALATYYATRYKVPLAVAAGVILDSLAGLSKSAKAEDFSNALSKTTLGPSWESFVSAYRSIQDKLANVGSLFLPGPRPEPIFPKPEQGKRVYEQHYQDIYPRPRDFVNPNVRAAIRDQHLIGKLKADDPLVVQWKNLETWEKARDQWEENKKIEDKLFEEQPKVAPVVTEVVEAEKPVEGGKAKKLTRWQLHVKDYAKQHGLNYFEAIKKAKASYKK